MVSINIDFANTCGPIKAMNGVNNGPLASSVRKTSTGFALYKELEIPYARLHDSAFQEIYGGEYSVDVHRVFPNFDADETDPAAYIFGPTDDYVANVYAAGTKPFYRLGASIEHVLTLPRILPSGQEFVSISFAITPKAGQTASTTIYSIGRFGTSRNAPTGTAPIPAGRVQKMNLLTFMRS